MKEDHQAEFVRLDGFDASGFNLHRHAGAGHRTLVIFVHGLNGRGYPPWGELPAQLWTCTDLEADLGFIQYDSGWRLVGRRMERVTYWRNRVVQAVDAVRNRYDHVFLAGHSMGGLVCAAAGRALLERWRTTDLHTPILRGLVMVASPRAGSLTAGALSRVPLLPHLVPEISLLRLGSEWQNNLDDYYSTNVSIDASPHPKKHHLPVFAIVAHQDRLVDNMSARLAIPRPQVLELDASHTTVARAVHEDTSLADFIARHLQEAIEIADQRVREAKHRALQDQRRVTQPQPYLVTRLLVDDFDADWTTLYDQLRQQVGQPDLHFLDHQQTESDVDLVISLHTAQLVQSNDAATMENLRRAIDLTAEVRKAGLGLSPHGTSYDAAKATLQSIVHAEGLQGSVFIEGGVTALDVEQAMKKFMRTMLDKRRVFMNQYATIDDVDRQPSVYAHDDWIT